MRSNRLQELGSPGRGSLPILAVPYLHMISVWVALGSGP